MSRLRPKFGDRAFTLIELLVVMAVTALLLAMLLPVLGNARESAKLLRCASQLRQIGLTLQTYANDHDSVLPPAATNPQFVPTAFRYATGGGFDFRPPLQPYTTAWEIWTCPAVGTAPLNDAGNNRAAGCYGTLAYMPGRTRPNFGFTLGTPRKMDNAYVASTLTLVQDEFRDDDGGPQLYNHGQGTVDQLAGNPSYGGYRGAAGDGINVVFFDGHASWTAAEQLNVVGPADQAGRRMFGVLPQR